MNVALGTVVRVRRKSTGGYAAEDARGFEVLGIPYGTLKSAYETGAALKLVPTTTGRTRWRRVNDMTAKAATAATDEGVVDISKWAKSADGLTIPTDHEGIAEFIRESYALKPAELKLDELRWKFAVRSVLRGDNLLILGPSGFGKTMTARMLERVFRRPFFKFNMGATQDPRSTLIGNTHFKPEVGTYVAESRFVHAVQTENAIILLDELSRAHPDAHNILMTVLDQSQRYLAIDERPDTPVLPVARGVTFIATANVGTEYTATRTMDRALIDRFVILELPPLSAEYEQELLAEMYPDLDPYLVKAIAGIACNTRDQVLKAEQPKVDTMVSTRMTVQMAGLCSDGFTLEEAAEICIYPFYSSAGGLDSPQTYMKQVVQGYVKDPNTQGKSDPFANGDPNGGAKTPWD